MSNQDYDVVIIGGGPGGLTAGLYTSRARLNSLLVERAMFGGQIANVMQVENYPGFPGAVDGFELGQLMHQQATNFGLKTIMAEATGISSSGGSVSDTLRVSPIPSSRSGAMPTADLIRPSAPSPASVTPRCRG